MKIELRTNEGRVDSIYDDMKPIDTTNSVDWARLQTEVANNAAFFVVKTRNELDVVEKLMDALMMEKGEFGWEDTEFDGEPLYISFVGELGFVEYDKPDFGIQMFLAPENGVFKFDEEDLPPFSRGEEVPLDVFLGGGM